MVYRRHFLCFTSREMASALPCFPPSRRQYIQRIPGYLTSDESNKSSSSTSGSWRTLSGGVESKSASISSGYGTPRAMKVDSYHRHLPPVPLTPMTSSGSASSANSAVYYYLRDGSMSGRDTLVEEAVPPSRKRSYNATKPHSGENYYKRRGREGPRSSHRSVYDFNVQVPPRRLEDRRKRSADPAFASASSAVFTPPVAHSRHNCPHHQHAHKHSHGDYINHSGNRRGSYGRSDHNTSWRFEYDDSPTRNLPPSSRGKWKSEANLFISSLDAESTQIYNEILNAANAIASDSQGVEEDIIPPGFQHHHKSCNNLVYDFESATPKIDNPKPIFEPTERRSNRMPDSFSKSQQRTPTNLPFSPWTPIEDGPFTDADTEDALAELDRAVNLTFVDSSKPTTVHKAEPVARGGSSPTEFSVIEIEEEDEYDNPIRGSRDAFPLDEVEKQLLSPTQQLTLSSPVKVIRGAHSPEDSSYYSDINE